MLTRSYLRRRDSWRVVSALAVVAALAPASASAATETVTLSSSGESPFIVPAGVTSIGVTLIGASGGAGDSTFSFDEAPGGSGGAVTASIAVTPGEVLFAEVGIPGSPGNAAGMGAGGGGGGGSGGLRAPAGGGGGATDIRTCSVTVGSPLNPGTCAALGSVLSRLVVAGGGGGGGGGGSAASTVLGGDGGSAGAAGGGGASGSAPAGGEGGGVATQTTGGTAGLSSDSSAAQPGTLAQGGTGGDESGTDFGGGGGGGGGLYGGGGGGGGECVPHSTSVCGSGGGGGGGSSGVPQGINGVSAVTTAVAATGAAPTVTFTWTLPAPTAITGPVSDLTATTATLNGTIDPNGSPVTSCGFTITPAPASGAGVACGSRSPGSGDTPVPVSAAVTGLAPSTTYTVRLTATGAQGTGTGQPVEFTTGAGSADRATHALRITAVAQSATRWRRGSSAAKISRTARIPEGTTFSFRLNERAAVKLTFARLAAGRVAGKRCVAPTKSLARARTCKRPVTAGSLTFTGRAAVNHVRFAGRLTKTHQLALGEYTMTITATASESHASAKPLTFTISR
jgi:hypothetical protein